MPRHQCEASTIAAVLRCGREAPRFLAILAAVWNRTRWLACGAWICCCFPCDCRCPAVNFKARRVALASLARTHKAIPVTPSLFQLVHERPCTSEHVLARTAQRPAAEMEWKMFFCRYRTAGATGTALTLWEKPWHCCVTCCHVCAAHHGPMVLY